MILTHSFLILRQIFFDLAPELFDINLQRSDLASERFDITSELFYLTIGYFYTIRLGIFKLPIGLLSIRPYFEFHCFCYSRTASWSLVIAWPEIIKLAQEPYLEVEPARLCLTALFPGPQLNQSVKAEEREGARHEYYKRSLETNVDSFS